MSASARQRRRAQMTSVSKSSRASESSNPAPQPAAVPVSEFLPRVGLLLDKTNPQNLLLNIRQQGIHNLRLLDPQPLREDLLHRHNLALLHLPAQLRLRDPADLLARTLTHQEVPNDAAITFF